MESFSDIISADGLVLVDFYATWCQPCQMMHPVLEATKRRFGERVRIIKVDIDRHQALAREYGVEAVPTLMLFRRGDMLWRQSGAMGEDALEGVVRHFS